MICLGYEYPLEIASLPAWKSVHHSPEQVNISPTLKFLITRKRNCLLMGPRVSCLSLVFIPCVCRALEMGLLLAHVPRLALNDGTKRWARLCAKCPSSTQRYCYFANGRKSGGYIQTLKNSCKFSNLHSPFFASV